MSLRREVASLTLSLFLLRHSGQITRDAYFNEDCFTEDVTIEQPVIHPTLSAAVDSRDYIGEFSIECQSLKNAPTWQVSQVWERTIN